MTPSGERPRVEELMGLIRSKCEYCDVASVERALTALVAERDEAVAILAEESSLVDACGTVLCRHQINHDRYDGCLYCDRDKLRAENVELRAMLNELISAITDDGQSNGLGISADVSETMVDVVRRMGGIQSRGE